MIISMKVLTNLLSNAKKYTQSGAVELKVYSVAQLTLIANRKVAPLLIAGTPTTGNLPTMIDLHEKKETKTGNEKAQDMDVDSAASSADKTILHFSIRDSGYLFLLLLLNYLYYCFFFILIWFVLLF